MVSAKQYVGVRIIELGESQLFQNVPFFQSPIQCWMPMEFKGGWEQYAEDYCFIQVIIPKEWSLNLLS